MSVVKIFKLADKFLTMAKVEDDLEAVEPTLYPMDTEGKSTIDDFFRGALLALRRDIELTVSEYHRHENQAQQSAKEAERQKQLYYIAQSLESPLLDAIKTKNVTALREISNSAKSIAKAKSVELNMKIPVVELQSVRIMDAMLRDLPSKIETIRPPQSSAVVPVQRDPKPDSSSSVRVRPPSYSEDVTGFTPTPLSDPMDESVDSDYDQ